MHEWREETINNTLGLLAAGKSWTWMPIAWETGAFSSIGIFFNPSRAPFQRYLTQQPHNFCALIEVFGPNQFVLVATSGDPCSSELTDLFSPQTLYGCLHFTYVCWSVIIHGVPKSSGARLCGHHQVGNLICRSVDWTQATFHANRERFGGLRYGHIDLPKDSYR